jgi:hypothetical protein
MKQVLYYKPRAGLNTNSVLREIRNIEALQELLIYYSMLLELASRGGFDGIEAEDIKHWYTSANENLPKRSDGNIRKQGAYVPRFHQSIKQWLEGMLEKVSRPTGKDLSPYQCLGTEKMSEQISIVFNTPIIEFTDIADKYYRPLPDFFEVKK